MFQTVHKLKTCESIDVEKFGRNAYLGSEYCEYEIPVKMFTRLFEKDLQRRQNKTKCCAMTIDDTYDGEIYINGIDIFHTEIAFGTWAVPKLKKELWSSDEIIVSKALITLIDMSYNPERSREIICHNIISRLGKLIISKNSFIKQKVSILIRLIILLPNGSNHFSENKYLQRLLLTGANDNKSEIRHEYLKTIYIFLTSLIKLELIEDIGYVEFLITKLKTEDHEETLYYIVHSLEHLANCYNSLQEKMILDNVIETVVDRLKSDELVKDDSIEGMTGLLAQLFKNDNGKKKFSNEILELLVNFRSRLLNFINIIRIISFAAILTKNKLIITKSKHINDIINILIESTKYDNEELQISSTQLLTIIAETKYGRDYLQKKIHFFEEVIFLNGDRKNVTKAINNLLSVIKWTPGYHEERKEFQNKN